MGDAITDFMLEKIKEHEDTYDGNNIRDFIDLYIQASRENKEEHKDTFTSIVFDLIKLTDLHITHLNRMNCPISIGRTNLFQILGVLVVFLNSYHILKEHSASQQ